MVQLALEATGSENPQLLQAVSGLCGGVKGGLVCGALTGAACMLNVMAPGRANDQMVPELTAWFVEAMGEAYGGADCATILDSEPLNRATRCPALMEATFLRAQALLEEHGCPWP